MYLFSNLLCKIVPFTDYSFYTIFTELFWKPQMPFFFFALIVHKIGYIVNQAEWKS